MNLVEIETKVLEIIERCRELGIALERLENMVSITKAGEPGIALEDLCTELFDHEARVPLDVLESIKILGTAMCLDAEYWRSLEERTA